MIVDGLVALYQIPAAVFSAKGSGLQEKAAAAFQEPLVQRQSFRVFRAFLPNSPVLPKQLHHILSKQWHGARDAP